MTLVSQIISDAYRLGNLTAIGTAPSLAQQDEALRYLNRIVKSTLGNEVGEPLEAFPLGTNGVSRPSGFPWWGQQPDNEWFVPKNKRLILNLTGPQTVYLHPMPNDGTRFAVSDTSGNLATNTLTVSANGRLIEGATSAVLNTNGLEREWFYRDDLGEWVKYATLIASDTFPFPEEFDDFFVTVLAVRLNPSYNASLDPQAQATMIRMGRQIKARYHQEIEIGSEWGLIKMPRTAQDRDGWGTQWDWVDPTSAFYKGLPWW